MIRFIAWRLLAGAGVLWGAATLTFLVLHFTPGDPAEAVVGGEGAAPTPEVLAQITAEYGLDRPWYEQYAGHLWRIVRGDFGTSYRLHTPVTQAIGEQAWATMELALAAAVTGLVLAVAVALATAGRRRWIRGLAAGAELLVASTPAFWLGIVLLTVFSFGLRLLPATGSHGLASLVLPALALALPIAGVLGHVLREALEEVLDEPFIVSARSRGLADTTVRVRHALRHALLPLVTMSGYWVGALLGGAVITETLFTRQGIGRLLVAAVNAKDLPVVLGVVLLSALVYVLVNLVVDLLYRVVDPRLKEAA
ncbi:ABC transporter permease [Nonomuraea jiangxiensis]|uniref:Peptide/nickel transport system permease protein n=1 Tax=Nonomuraea jiangxiensis TaxID=633440 RepID=A0A1G9N6I4_9ACTN|nr:ABC transporter permease [Nonomuraea jiangxiensis]SDL81737.1 peptide/nickel transport system permease protein [Nonomuraea jiangxiensis]